MTFRLHPSEVSRWKVIESHAKYLQNLLQTTFESRTFEASLKHFLGLVVYNKWFD